MPRVIRERLGYVGDSRLAQETEGGRLTSRLSKRTAMRRPSWVAVFPLPLSTPMPARAHLTQRRTYIPIQGSPNARPNVRLWL